MSNVLLLRNFAEDKRTSMEVYADNLLSALTDQTSSMNYRYYRPATRYAKNGQVGKWAMRIARYIEYPDQIKRFRAHLYHITEHGYAHLIKHLPEQRTIVTVHDLIPLLKHKGLIHGVKPQANPWLARYSLSFIKRAGHIIAISENTKKDLINHCGCPEEKISVVYYGLPELTNHRQLSKAQARQQLNLPQTDQMLVLVTGQEFYKNLETSVKVLNRIRKNHELRLVHLGMNNSVWQRAKSLADAPEAIIELSQIPHADVVKLYKAVDCVLFPSWYEGFGLPPLEAMACGTPAVTSNTASLPEAVADAALTAEPDDIEHLSSCVERVLTDTDLRNQLIEKGIRQAGKFNWTNCAVQTQAIYRKVLNSQS